MIKPSVGRVMWYWPHKDDRGDQPLCALVTYVHGEHMVNLSVFDRDGSQRGETSVPVVQDGSPYAAGESPFCEWMPYQLGQAKRTEAAEATKAAEPSAIFSQNRSASMDSMKIDQIAMACYQANKGLCEAFGDQSQKDWPDAPEWARESARKGVEFCLANPDAPASANHDSWLEEKRRTGWKYGPVKDESKREHPCFVPYDELPKEQQVKDHVFRAIVHALA